MFEAGGLLALLSPGRVKECFIRHFDVIRFFFVVSYFLLFNNEFPDSILDAMLFQRFRKNLVDYFYLCSCNLHLVLIFMPLTI